MKSVFKKSLFHKTELFFLKSIFVFVLIFEYIEVGILQSLDLGRISILYSKMRHYWLRSILKEHYFPQFFPFFLNHCEAFSNSIVIFFSSHQFIK